VRKETSRLSSCLQGTLHLQTIAFGWTGRLTALTPRSNSKRKRGRSDADNSEVENKPIERAKKHDVRRSRVTSLASSLRSALRR